MRDQCLARILEWHRIETAKDHYVAIRVNFHGLKISNSWKGVAGRGKRAARSNSLNKYSGASPVVPCLRSPAVFNRFSQMSIGRLHVGKFLPGYEVALNIVHSALYFAFVFGGMRKGGTNQEAIMQCQLPDRLLPGWDNTPGLRSLRL